MNETQMNKERVFQLYNLNNTGLFSHYCKSLTEGEEIKKNALLLKNDNVSTIWVLKEVFESGDEMGTT